MSEQPGLARHIITAISIVALMLYALNGVMDPVEATITTQHNYLLDIGVEWSTSLNIGVWHIAWSPDGLLLAVGGGQEDTSGRVVVLDQNGQIIWESQEFQGGVVRRVSWSPDSSKLVAGGGFGGVVVFDRESNILWSRKISGKVYSVAWSPDGKKIVAGTDQPFRIIVFDENGNLLWENNDVTGNVLELSWSPTSDKLAAAIGWGYPGSTVTVLDSDGNILWSKGQSDYVTSVAWSPDGTMIAVGLDNGRVILYDQDGNVLWESDQLDGSVVNIAWSPDGTKIAVGGFFPEVIIFNVEGNILSTIEELEGNAWTASWNPNGDKLAISIRPNKITVFNLNLPEIGILDITGEPGTELIISGNGDRAYLTLPASGEIRVYVTPGEYTINYTIPIPEPYRRYYIGDTLGNKITTVAVANTITRVELPKFLDFVGILYITGKPGSAITLSWNNGEKTLTIPESRNLTIYAFPGEYSVISSTGTKNIRIGQGETTTVILPFADTRIQGPATNTSVITTPHNSPLTTDTERNENVVNVILLEPRIMIYLIFITITGLGVIYFIIKNRKTEQELSTSIHRDETHVNRYNNYNLETPTVIEEPPYSTEMTPITNVNYSDSFEGVVLDLPFKPPKIEKLNRFLSVGPYEARSLVGSGGVAVTLLAVDDYGNSVVLKIPKQAFEALYQGIRYGPSSLARRLLEREFRILSGLRHPHIVKVVDYGIDDATGVPFLALEYCSNGSLRGVLENAGRLDEWNAGIIGYQVARALSYLHERGIIHRDLKPENILFTEEGLLKVTDFNIAKFAMAAQPGSGSIIGYTPGYAAPEQLFHDLGRTGPYTDVWSLGVILYEMLAGEPPFDPSNYIDSIRGRPSLSPIPYRYRRIIERMLSFNPAERPSADEVADLITRILSRR